MKFGDPEPKLRKNLARESVQNNSNSATLNSHFAATGENQFSGACFGGTFRKAGRRPTPILNW